MKGALPTSIVKRHSWSTPTTTPNASLNWCTGTCAGQYLRRPQAASVSSYFSSTTTSVSCGWSCFRPRIKRWRPSSASRLHWRRSPGASCMSFVRIAEENLLRLTSPSIALNTEYNDSSQRHIHRSRTRVVECCKQVVVAMAHNMLKAKGLLGMFWG